MSHQNRFRSQSGPIVVLKFGSSILRTERDLPLALFEIYRELRQGHRVVAVVSAFGDTTDDLLGRARNQFDTPHESLVARLLETGEVVSAAYLGMTLEESGVPAEVLDPSQAQLIASGPLLDAEPCDVDTDTILGVLDQVPVVVIPGFAGRCPENRPVLLGRGGSDFTALFLACRLGAMSCRLVKDVDGLHAIDEGGEIDRNRRYSEATFEDAARVGGQLVQPKAIRFAADRGIPFDISGPGTTGGTRVGTSTSRIEQCPAKRPIRIGLAGLGTVGLGVFRWIELLHDQYQVCGILVADRTKSRPADVPAALLLTDPCELFETQPDILVEAIGGRDTASELAEIAAERQVPFITANKELVANDPGLLERIAAVDDDTFLCSASVGGSLPVLERIRQIRLEDEIHAVSGVVNGTCNFVLDRILAGQSPSEAIADAQRLGYAEPDPSFDIEGLDARSKAAIIASLAFGDLHSPDSVPHQGITNVSEETAARASQAGTCLRLVAEVRREATGVELRELPIEHRLSQCRGADNRVVIETASGKQIEIAGKGAGRWPTALAVLGDIQEIRARMCTANSVRNTRSTLNLESTPAAASGALEEIK